jgi:predicted deacetylase
MPEWRVGAALRRTVRPAGWMTAAVQFFIAILRGMRQASEANGLDVIAPSTPSAPSAGREDALRDSGERAMTSPGDATPDRRLLVSIHDVSPRSESAVDALADRLQRHLGGPQFAMLVIPDHWNEAPIASNAAFHARLRRWADQGIEMFLHGWCHRDETPARGGFSRIKAQHMTAGEGEFLSLSQDEAARRMRAGKILLEDILGRPVAGFIAPAWLYGPGALAALDEVGFALAEDHMKVWAPGAPPVDQRVLSRGPVVTWASRSPGRIRSSLAFAALARIALPVLPTLRVAVHPGDVTVPALLGSIDATVARFATTHRPARYATLMA